MKPVVLFILFLTCVATIAPHHGMAQKTNGNIGLADVSESLDQLKSQLNTSKNDTNKVKVLIKLATIEWHLSTAKPQLDSCLNFGSEAMALSQQLHYTYGFTESALVLCKVYLFREDFNS